MADTTAAEHKEAVQAVSGNLAPEPPEQQVAQGDAVVVTRDLASEQKKDQKLDDEVLDAMGGNTAVNLASLDSEERQVLAKRTLENGKTEALLAEAPAHVPFPPDDGGYNPEKRQFAGPGGTKVPSAVGKNQPVNGGLPEGWRERDLTKDGKKAFNR